MNGMTQHCCPAALHANHPGDGACHHPRVKNEVKWLSSASGGNAPALTTSAFASWGHKSLRGAWPERHFAVRLSLCPVQTSLLCRQDCLFSHSRERQSSGVWSRAWLSLGASQVQAGLISGGTGSVFEGNTLPAPLKPYQGSGCFIYNDFSCRMAPVCYSCIEYAQIILVHGVIGGIAKLHLMTEWQPSVVRAFNVISWRIIFFLPVKLKETGWGGGRWSLGFICFAFNWFWRLKLEWKYQLESPGYWLLLFLSKDVHGKHIVSLPGPWPEAVRTVLVSPSNVVMGDVTLFLQARWTVEAKCLR